jgi:hypothetical protein
MKQSTTSSIELRLGFAGGLVTKALQPTLSSVGFAAMGVDRSRALLERFGDRPFRVGEAEPVGVPRYELYRLRDRGELVNVSRGVFRRVGGAVSSSTDLATVCARVPRGIVCLNSALAYWDLSDELPAVVHVAVARGAHRPHIEVPATEVHVFAAATFTLERREERTETGELLSIYSPERAVVDAMRLAHRAGRDTALHALNRYMRGPDAQPRRLLAIARELGGQRRLTDALEAVMS